jgi:hypothetical protein
MTDSVSDRLQKYGTGNTDAVDAAVSAAEGGTIVAKKEKKKKKKKKVVEKVGSGQSSFDMDAFVAKTNAQIAATQNPSLKAKLKARIAAVKANAQ